MENEKIERMTVEGRRTEVHVVEQPVEGATYRTSEYFEEIIPLERRRKVTERIVPVVVERVTEQYNGNQVDKVVEMVDHALQLKLVPHQPVTASEVEAIVRKAIQPPVSHKLFGWFNNFFTDFTNSSLVSYVLVGLLALGAGFMIWQFFIR
jgi:hypothetical protein